MISEERLQECPDFSGYSHVDKNNYPHGRKIVNVKSLVFDAVFLIRNFGSGKVKMAP
jgi:hypothetical protein